jgi:hypothetical protein
MASAPRSERGCTLSVTLQMKRVSLDAFCLNIRKICLHPPISMAFIAPIQMEGRIAASSVFAYFASTEESKSKSLAKLILKTIFFTKK